MVRLTKRDEEGNLLLLEEERLFSSRLFIDREEMNNIKMHLAEKLAEYEDQEEQGLLVKLPCKVGDTIYVKIGTDAYVKLDVLDFAYHKSCGFYIVCGYYDTPKCEMPLSDFGKNFFLTNPQAEQALKEMEDDNNDQNNM